MDTYVNGKKISLKERQRRYLENLKNPIPGIDMLWHKYTMSDEDFLKIHGVTKERKI